MKKKLISLLMAGALAAGLLAGCGGKDAQGGKEAETPKQEEAAKPAQEEQQEPAQEEQTKRNVKACDQRCKPGRSCVSGMAGEV